MDPATEPVEVADWVRACKKTMSEARSAGETPEMRDACPSVCGRIAASFWRASVEMFRPGRRSQSRLADVGIRGA